MHKRQHGFTLIEMMIVIAVIGVLAAIAGLAYADYIARAKATEVFYLGDGIKSPLMEYAYVHGSWPELVGPEDAAGSGKLNITLTGKYGTVDPEVSGIFPAGTVTYIFNNTTSIIGSESVEFSTTDGGSTWTCSGGTLPSRYRPTACQE